MEAQAVHPRFLPPTMKPPKAKLALAVAAAALLGAPTSAAAADVVPPQNSAANQYTETYPTAGGDRETRRADNVGGGGSSGGGTNGGGGAKIDPAKERALEAAGADGRAVVDLVEGTAPVAATQAPAATPAQADAGSKGGTPSEQRPSSGTGGEALRVSDSSPSGAGEVLGQMTGASSSGELGPLLPLLVLVTLAWAAGFFWRRRGETA
jgi:hypothetical protein